MATIVEYNALKAPLNAYPIRIVSPPAPSPCCLTHMEQVGSLQEEDGWQFYYKRCPVCGFTVRYFLPRPWEDEDLVDLFTDEELAILRVA